jgi:hypothetical protein
MIASPRDLTENRGILRSVPLRAWTFKFVSKDLFRMKPIFGQIFCFLISLQDNTVFNNELLICTRANSYLPLGDDCT